MSSATLLGVITGLEAPHSPRPLVVRSTDLIKMLYGLGGEGGRSAEIQINAQAQRMRSAQRTTRAGLHSHPQRRGSPVRRRLQLRYLLVTWAPPAVVGRHRWLLIA